MVRRASILIFILLLSSGLFGQKILDFDKLSIDDGFTSSKANVIIQDRKGFIWIGTWNGLNRYDGYEVETFRPVYHDSSSISNREVLALLEDRNGDIWIGTTSGLNRYNPMIGEWKKYNFQNRITSLLEDSNGIIWVGTWEGGLFKLDPETGEMEHYLPTSIISDIYEDSRNILWIATYHGLVTLDRSNSSYVRFLPDRTISEGSIGHTIITQIEESPDGSLWLGTWGGGLEKVHVTQDRDSIQFSQYRVRDGEGSLSSNVVYRLHYDSYGNLWIGTWDGGLNLLEKSQQDLPPDESDFISYQNDLRNAYGLSGNNISALFVDQSGILWIGSSMIDRTNIIDKGIRRYKTTRIVDGMYTENSARSFGRIDDLLWVGTIDELKLYRSSNGHFSFVRDIARPEYRYKSAIYNSSSILAIIANDDGLWAGTEDAGLVFYPGNSSREESNPDFIFYNTLTDPALPGNKISNMVESRKYPGVIWIGTLQNGFAKLTYMDGKAEVEDFDVGLTDNAISDNNVRAIVEDKDGLVWIGTQNGLNCFDPATRVFHKYFYSFSDTTTINDNVINVLHEDKLGNLWIGSTAGINRKIVRIKDDESIEIQFQGFPNMKNISDEIITNILEDDSGNLWIGYYKGMDKLNIDQTSIEQEFFSKDFQHLVVERNSAISDKQGTFFVGGGSGFITFSPDSLPKGSLPPKVCITDLIVSNESYEEYMSLDKKSDSLVTAIPYKEHLTLSPKSRILTFIFSAMDYKDPKRNQYIYLLEGFDNNWNEAGNRNSATYTNIRPGKYVFKVKASNSDGVWSDDAAILSFTISTPWWQSKLAILVYVLIVIGLLYFFNQYSIIGVKDKSRIKIEHMQYEKEHELNEEKTLFLTNITHEFRTPLTLILGPAEELLKTRELSLYARKQSELIQKNAHRLLRLVNQLMEFRKVEKGKMEIYLKKANIVPLINDIYESFRTMANSKLIELSMKVEKQELIATVDTEKFEKVMFNLVLNAFKFSEEGSKITIRAGIEKEEEGDWLVVEIEDTGIGIAEEHKEKIFERFFQTHQLSTQSTGGIGLYLSKNFIEMHGGRIELESELGQGSCFRVIIPVEKPDTVVELAEISLETEIDEQVGEVEQEMDNITNTDGEKDMARVLIVEDDHELIDFIISGLSSDFNVSGSYNGKEGLEMARKLTPDIIITDIMMPEMDGIEMCRILRQDITTSHIPVVFLTAKTMREDEITGLKIGAVDYIYKPFNLETLKLKIHNLLDIRKRVQDRIRTNQLMEPEYIELSSLDEKFLKDAVDAVNNNLDDPSFDVEKFSYEIRISSNQTYRKIKALTGQTAKEFIRNQRLKTSASLLLQKKRSISEIIYMVGFSSPSYFTRCFKDYYGCTPKEYIEKSGKV